jgi:hypothetical protein
MEAAVVPKAAVRDWDALGDDNRVGWEWAAEVVLAECSDDRAASPASAVAPVESADDPKAYRAGAGSRTSFRLRLAAGILCPGIPGCADERNGNDRKGQQKPETIVLDRRHVVSFYAARPARSSGHPRIKLRSQTGNRPWALVYGGRRR